MRRGFLLIELSVTIVILMIIISASIIGVEKYKAYKDEVKWKEDVYEVRDFLSRAKARAINRKKPQSVGIENKTGVYTFTLEEEGRKIEGLSLEGTWKDINFSINRDIDINVDGYINPCTINMVNIKGYSKISIQVGGNTINVKDSE